MKRTNLIALGTCALCLALLLFPYGKASASVSDVGGSIAATESSTLPKTTEASSAGRDTASDDAETDFDRTLTLRVLDGEQVEEMTLYDYLTGVLLAEMPASFPLEALKAQAVASRTFALRKSKAEKHSGADICTNSACCQGREDPALCPEASVRAVQKAISETDGQVIVYDGELIDATFFSCTGGRTESAVAVWGSDIPYLQAVESPNEEDAPRYSESRIFTPEEFSAQIAAAYPEAKLSGKPSDWFGTITYTVGGGIEYAVIGGVSISGTELRSILGLRSTDIELQVGEDSIRVTTYGYGHRVGMSQYGAKAMAEHGSGYEEILTHYYLDTELRRLYLETPQE